MAHKGGRYINHKPIPPGENPKVPTDADVQNTVDGCIQSDPKWASHKNAPGGSSKGGSSKKGSNY